MRLQVLLDALCVSPVFNSLLIPANLQLAVYVTGFWLNHAQPEPKAEMFWALLIGLVYGHLCREHQTAIGKDQTEILKDQTEIGEDEIKTGEDQTEIIDVKIRIVKDQREVMIITLSQLKSILFL